jgi:hypothetical protein
VEVEVRTCPSDRSKVSKNMDFLEFDFLMKRQKIQEFLGVVKIYDTESYSTSDLVSTGKWRSRMCKLNTRVLSRIRLRYQTLKIIA